MSSEDNAQTDVEQLVLLDPNDVVSILDDEDVVFLLEEIRSTGFAARSFLEDGFEDYMGAPLPADDRPTLRYDVDAGATIAELDDLAPLVFQLAWALLEEADRDV